MEVITSSGRRVSLLNDHNDAPSYDYSAHSSPATSPGALSVTTPSLTRSESSDSHRFPSPSPLTPDMSTDSIATSTAAAKMAATVRPHIAQQSSYSYSSPQPYPILSPSQDVQSPKQLAYLQTTLPPIDAHNARYAQTPKASTKKNHYPCPVAKQYGCHDFFTTSGHAARHAKKHTGKKDAVCPECSKAFTRKDNMEQHRRTHSGGRNLSSSTATKAQVDASRERKALRQQQQQQLQRRRSRTTNGSLSDFALDPQLQSATSSPYMPMSDYEFPQQPLKVNTHAHQRPELRRSSQDGSISFMRSAAQGSPQYSTASPSLTPSLAPALDALALAASRQ